MHLNDALLFNKKIGFYFFIICYKHNCTSRKIKTVLFIGKIINYSKNVSNCPVTEFELKSQLLCIIYDT